MLVYAATNVGNPLTAPALILAELQAGHRILRGSWLGLSLDEVRSYGLSGLFVDVEAIKHKAYRTEVRDDEPAGHD